MNIPIVIAAHSRSHTLNRLLRSLEKAIIRQGTTLIISIDGGNNYEVVDLAEKYAWKFGKKVIVKHDANLGLKNHLLMCGRISTKYDGVILLEDDLYVARNFYEFAIAAQEKYKYDNRISGVALYSPNYNETATLPFTPIQDEHDVFFMQIACSWGQCWLKTQWEEFDSWYREHELENIDSNNSLPPNVRMWPDNSWKKYFQRYMSNESKYFVYPKISLSTNFGDLGSNHKGTNLYQVPLHTGVSGYKFPDFENSCAVYDDYGEISAKTIQKYVRDLRDYDFDVDLYGMKNKRDCTKEFVLTSQELNSSLIEYGRNLKPQEMNVLEEIPGNEISFGHRSDMSDYGDFLKYRDILTSNHEKTTEYYFCLTKRQIETNFRISICGRITKIILESVKLLTKKFGLKDSHHGT